MGGVIRTVAKIVKPVVKVVKSVVHGAGKFIGTAVREVGKVVSKVPGLSTVLGAINPVAGAVGTALEVGSALLSKPEKPSQSPPPPPPPQVPQPKSAPSILDMPQPKPPEKKSILGVSLLDNLVEGVETIFHKAEDFGKHIARSWLLGDLKELFG